MALRLAKVGLAAGALVLAAPATAQRGDPLRGLDAYVRQAVRDWNVPGLAIGIVQGDSVVFARGYGVRALGADAPVTTRTLFANASTTKAFTALAVALLVDEGKLHWDDPVARHLPGFTLRDPYATQELRLRDLLTHRVGFGDPEGLWYGATYDFTEIVRRLRFVAPQSSFRARYAYNNVTYATAGEIAGRVAGTTWDELVRRRILEPLGMSATLTQGKDLPAGADVAQKHDAVDGALRPISGVGADDAAHGLVDPIAPAGSMYSNVEDMTRWLRFLLDSGRVDGKRLVSESAFAELFRPQTVIRVEDFYATARLTRPHFTAYAMGWFLQDYRGDFVAFHTGSIDGTVAIVGLLPERRLGVVIFANRDHAELRHALMLRVFDLYLGGPPRDWSRELRALYDSLAQADRERRRRLEERRVPDTRPSLPLERYAGTYADSAYGDVTIRVDTGRLVLERSPFLTADVEHWHYDVFRVAWRHRWIRPAFATFHIGPDGEVNAVEAGGRVWRRVRPGG